MNPKFNLSGGNRSHGTFPAVVRNGPFFLLRNPGSRLRELVRRKELHGRAAAQTRSAKGESGSLPAWLGHNGDLCDFRRRARLGNRDHSNPRHVPAVEIFENDKQTGF